ncbi:MAG TPA: DivIVA domain-containing protein [Nocardioidaceae bacterium]|nr:DivIVA domain-containing protein [Nocardioidaceae bacterium]
MREPTSPLQLREMRFTTRVRGLDRDEVNDVLNHVADDIDHLLSQVKDLRAENQRLGQRIRQQAPPSDMDSVTDQAVQLFSQAQQVADSLIEEAVLRARELLSTARSQQRGIMDEAHQAARQAAARVSDTIGAPETGQAASMQEIEYVRTFAKVAQLQFRAVLEALNDQVDKLGEMPQVDAESVPPTSRPGTSGTGELPGGSELDPPFMRREWTSHTP